MSSRSARPLGYLIGAMKVRDTSRRGADRASFHRNYKSVRNDNGVWWRESPRQVDMPTLRGRYTSPRPFRQEPWEADIPDGTTRRLFAGAG